MIAIVIYRAQPVTPEELPRVHAAVARLAQKIGITAPKIHVIHCDLPNAFFGRCNRIAITDGILSLLNDEELEGVLAHELCHIANRDALKNSSVAILAAAVAGAIGVLVNVGPMTALLGIPIGAVLIQLWISRTREYKADAGAVNYTGNPYALASALRKMDGYTRRSNARLWFFGFGFGNLFGTHPPIAKRIERLTAAKHGPVQEVLCNVEDGEGASKSLSPLKP